MSLTQVTNITVDVAAPQMLVIHEKQNDSGRWIYASITDNGSAFSIPANTAGVVRIAKPDGNACVYDSDTSGSAVIIDGHTVKVKLVDQALTAPGIAIVSVGLYNSSSEKITSFNFKLDIEKDAVTDQTIVSSSYYNILTQQISQAVASWVALTGLTVSTTTLAAGSDATVTKTQSGGSYNFAFGIPRGAPSLQTSFYAFSNITVPVSAFSEISDYIRYGYAYRVRVNLSELVNSSMVAIAVLSLESSNEINLSSKVTVGNGYIDLYADRMIQFTLDTVLCVSTTM